MTECPNIARCHELAADRVRLALSHLRVAVNHEAGLEWDRTLRDLLAEAERIESRLRAYAAAERNT